MRAETIFDHSNFAANAAQMSQSHLRSGRPVVKDNVVLNARSVVA
jgi:hypothetical protein